jgi:hypothetical protein
MSEQWWYKKITLVCPVCKKVQLINEKCYGEPEAYNRTEEEYCGCLDEDETHDY